MATKMVTVREDDGFDLPRLGLEDGTAFGYFDRLNMMGMDPKGKYVTDRSDWEARDMHEMLTKDYKAKQIENVLTLPLTSAEHSIVESEGDTGEAKWLRDYWDTDAYAGGCRTSLNQIIGLMTSAFYYKRAYFEKVWRKGVGKFAGKFVYDDVAWRPQTTCRILRDPINGRFRGFEQEAYFVGPGIRSNKQWPIQIKPNRAFVYTHGTRRDPLNGTSDFEVAFWAWKTKQKVLLLWFQFLQSVSLPRLTVKAGTTEEARAIASEIARMKSSGVLPLGVPGSPDSVAIEALDISGKGAEQFKQAIDWLDNAATQSVLAGFLDLVAHATTAGAGSYALSKDASDFFLQSLEAKAREMEDQIRRQLFAPLIRHNFGNDAAVPKLVFEPLNDIDKETAVELLKQAMAAPPGGPVPTSFISELAGQVANYLGLDGDSAREDFKKSFDAAAAQAQAKLLADAGAAGGTPAAQGVAGLHGAVKAAQDAIQTGVDPRKAHADAKKAFGGDMKGQAQAGKAQAARHALLEKHTKNAIHAKTGGDASLSNEDTDLAKKPQPEGYVKETKQIKARKGEWIGKPHDFKAAEWTHPNGHPRCKRCGQEEPVGGKCTPPTDLSNLDLSKLTKAERDALPASAFVFPGERRYPIHDKGHAHAAIKDSAGTKDEAAVRAAVAARYGWDLSNIDLAGFNPAEPRTAGGTWGAGGQAAKKTHKGAGHATLLAERARLRQEVANLKVVLFRLDPTHSNGPKTTQAGKAGKHSGPKGTAAGSSKAGPSGHAPKGAAPAGHVDLAAQVKHLRVEVEHLKREIVDAQQAKARRARRG